MVRGAVIEDARRVGEFLNQRSPTGFLGAIAYDADSYEIVAASEAIRPVVESDDFSTLIENARGIQAEMFDAGGADAHLGTPQATTLSFQGLLIIQLPVSETEAVLVALTPDVGSQFTSFVDSCRARLKATDGGPAGPTRGPDEVDET